MGARVGVAWLVAGCLAGITLAEEAPKLDAIVGQKIETFALPDASGKEVSLADYAKDKYLVVAFLGTECPLVKLYADRLSEMAKEYGKRGVGFIGVDANIQDSPEEIAAFAKAHAFKFPILIDAKGEVADKFTAKRNPEVFVLDADRVVRYRGRIDDQYGLTEGGSYQKSKENEKPLIAALDALIGGSAVPSVYVEAPGCLIGRAREQKTDSPVTYSKDIAPIIQNRCELCHRPGDIGPFALQDYDEVAGWGEMIDEVVRDQRMPPWHADPSHGQFSNDARMTDEEKAAIHTWVENGCPEGDPKDLPPPRKFVEGWRIGKPDKVFSMGSAFKVPAEGVLDYKYYTVKTGFKKDMWVKAAECRPGNRAVVHHIIVFVKSPGQSVQEIVLKSSFLASTAPGAEPLILRAGLAKKIPAGSELLFQMHYTTNGTAQVDKSEIGLKFIDEKDVTGEVKTDIAGTFLFQIPPNAADFKVPASTTFNADAMLLCMYPHMHVRGKAFKYEARYPDGTTEVLLDVPNYDFNWQNTYHLKEPKFLPKGTELNCVATYDNSAANLNNPDPSQAVHFGDQTWDEMMLGFFDAVVIDKAGYDKLVAEIKSSPSEMIMEDDSVATVAHEDAAANDPATESHEAGEAAEEEKEKPKRVQVVSSRSKEEKAESYLNLAKALVSRDKKKAKLWAQKVIDFAPDSESAEKAKALIKELTPKR